MERLKKIGEVKAINSQKIETSRIGIGMENLTEMLLNLKKYMIRLLH